ncbi:tetratricopeptide repeat protein [Asanoa sp. NPDC049518]|uniref:tetratricopeptide repeat protein n=1 Tax=unclassified Asanoa TaxID=2685164 RepID=UPI0034333ED7
MAVSLTGSDPDVISDSLDELVRGHLLTPTGGGRYVLHDLVRDYAGEISGRMDREAALHRVLDDYVHSAHRADTVLGTTRWQPPSPARDGVRPETIDTKAQAVSWFETHRDSISAVIDASADTDHQATWRIAASVANFLSRSGYRRQPLEMLHVGLSAAMKADETATAECHRLLGRAYAVAGEFPPPHEHLSTALATFAAVADTAGLAIANRNLAWLFEQEGEDAMSLLHNTRALDLYNERSEPRGQALALNAIGWDHARMASYDLALSYCGQAIDVLEDLDDHLGVAVTLDSLGYIHHRRGDHARAIACYGRSLALLPDPHDRYNRAEVLDQLGDAHFANHDRAAAAEAWLAAADLLRELDHPDLHAVLRKLAGAAAHAAAPQSRHKRAATHR